VADRLASPDRDGCGDWDCGGLHGTGPLASWLTSSETWETCGVGVGRGGSAVWDDADDAFSLEGAPERVVQRFLRLEEESGAGVACVVSKSSSSPGKNILTAASPDPGSLPPARPLEMGPIDRESGLTVAGPAVGKPLNEI
jgi:hypothetical protein